MYQLKSLEDTIAAIATPAGVGGIGIVRLSGKEAIAIAGDIFCSKDGRKPSQYKSHTVHYGWVVQPGGGIIDEVLLTVMRAPKSYTAQDVVEISCHGGMAAVRALLDLVLAAGARMAEPGEFTKRAFLNGRIDLAQAEAVLDIIRARTDAFLRVSIHQLKGELSTQLDAVRAELISVYTIIEAIINFPEDDIDAQGRKQILERIQSQSQSIDRLLLSSENGRILKDGIRMVICGKPNVGKSSLLNVLLKQERAIVTDIAGTTRDALEEPTQIQGVPFQLVDTAGILEPRDLIEQEAVKRSHLFIDSADLVLLVLDASRPLEEGDHLLMEKIKGRRVLVVLNKSDLPVRLDEAVLPEAKIKVSALHKTSIDQLEAAILKAVWQGDDFEAHGIFISNVRHIHALKSARSFLSESVKLMNTATSWEFISQDIKEAVNHLDSITGRNIDQDLLDRIFSEFCIGK